MPVTQTYDEADGVLMPGLVFKRGAIARIGDGVSFLKVWPSEPPQHIADAMTLTLSLDEEVIEEIGRYPSFDAVRDAAQRYVDHRRGTLPDTR